MQENMENMIVVCIFFGVLFVMAPDIAQAPGPQTPSPALAPLLLAAQNHAKEEVATLLQGGANANVKDKAGNTALHMLSLDFLEVDRDSRQWRTETDMEIAENLIRHGANVNAVNMAGESPLLQSVRLNRDFLTELLVNNGADTKMKNASGKSALDISAGFDNDFGVAVIVERRLFEAVQARNQAGIAALLAHPAVVAAVNTSECCVLNPLHFAAKQGHKDVATLLIQKGVQLELFDYNGPTMSNFGSIPKTALQIAAARGNIDVAAVLIEKGANMTRVNSNGRNAMLIAAENNQTSMVEFFISKGIPVDLKDSNGGYTALHIAAYNGYTALADRLIKLGANVNITNDDGSAPLHNAVLNNRTETAELLVEKGADVNVKDKDNNNTPLFYAIRNGYKAIAQMLLLHGADANAVNNNDETPIGMALEKCWVTY